MRKATKRDRDGVRGWEYRVETLGSIWRGPSREEMEALLNGANAEGWELVTAVNVASSNRIHVFLRRAIPARSRPRRDTWP